MIAVVVGSWGAGGSEGIGEGGTVGIGGDGGGDGWLGEEMVAMVALAAGRPLGLAWLEATAMAATGIQPPAWARW